MPDIPAIPFAKSPPHAIVWEIPERMIEEPVDAGSAIDLKAKQLSWTFQTDASRKNAPALTKPDGSPDYAAVYVENFYDDMVAGVRKTLSTGPNSSSRW